MKKFVLKTLIFLFLNNSIFAAEISQVVSKNFQSHFLIGSSRLNFIGLKVYDIELWSEDEIFSYNKKFAILIRYNMNFSKEDLAKKSIEEIERLHVLSNEEHRDYFTQLTKIFRSVKKGDEKLAIFSPNQGVEMFYNNNSTGKVTNLKLARLFVDIWLDEKGSYPRVTREILGK
ncbi:MAG: chalcone isomerase family protein [Rickettsiales bacterium]|nr:chalcone isomerase family protein [Rickettsiales bacterium]